MYKSESDFVKSFLKEFRKQVPLGFCNKNDAQASKGIPDYTFCVPPNKTFYGEFKLVSQKTLNSYFKDNFTDLSEKALSDTSKRAFYQSLNIIRFKKQIYYINFDKKKNLYYTICYGQEKTFDLLNELVYNMVQIDKVQGGKMTEYCKICGKEIYSEYTLPYTKICVCDPKYKDLDEMPLSEYLLRRSKMYYPSKTTHGFLREPLKSNTYYDDIKDDDIKARGK